MIFKSFFLNLTLIKSANIVGRISAYSCPNCWSVQIQTLYTHTHAHTLHKLTHTYTHSHIHIYSHTHSTHTRTHTHLSLPLVLPFLIMLTRAEFQTFLFTFEIAIGSEDTCKELWSKTLNTTVYSIPFDWDLKFKSILESYFKRVLNSTVVIVLLNVCERRNFTATEDVKFIYKIRKIRRNPLPQLTTENASWRFMGFMNRFRKYFISLQNDKVGKDTGRSCRASLMLTSSTEMRIQLYTKTSTRCACHLSLPSYQHLTPFTLRLFSWTQPELLLLYFRPIAFSIGIIHALRPAGDSSLCAQLSLTHAHRALSLLSPVIPCLRLKSHLFDIWVF